MKRLLLLLACLCLVAGPVACSTTVRPRPVISRSPSFDGNEFNSGFIRFEASGSGVITENARARFNALVAVYGRRFTVPLLPDAGITPMPPEAGQARWRITPEALVHFSSMSRWRRSGVGETPHFTTPPTPRKF